jgi:hypothetical protein
MGFAKNVVGVPEVPHDVRRQLDPLHSIKTDVPRHDVRQAGPRLEVVKAVFFDGSAIKLEFDAKAPDRHFWVATCELFRFRCTKPYRGRKLFGPAHPGFPAECVLPDEICVQVLSLPKSRAISTITSRYGANAWRISSNSWRRSPSMSSGTTATLIGASFRNRGRCFTKIRVLVPSFTSSQTLPYGAWKKSALTFHKEWSLSIRKERSGTIAPFSVAPLVNPTRSVFATTASRENAFIFGQGPTDFHSLSTQCLCENHDQCVATAMRSTNSSKSGGES